MHQVPRTIAPLLLFACAACGGSGDDEEREAMKPEETVVGGLVTAPARAEDRANAALDAHREELQQRLREDEGDAAERE